MCPKGLYEFRTTGDTPWTNILFNWEASSSKTNKPTFFRHTSPGCVKFSYNKFPVDMYSEDTDRIVWFKGESPQVGTPIRQKETNDEDAYKST